MHIRAYAPTCVTLLLQQLPCVHIFFIGPVSDVFTQLKRVLVEIYRIKKMIEQSLHPSTNTCKLVNISPTLEQLGVWRVINSLCNYDNFTVSLNWKRFKYEKNDLSARNHGIQVKAGTECDRMSCMTKKRRRHPLNC